MVFFLLDFLILLILVLILSYLFRIGVEISKVREFDGKKIIFVE